MILRLAKTVLVLGVALQLSLLALNNLTDYDSNYQFVRHVLMMDTTLPGNHEMWRASSSPAIHTLFYWTIIAWEFASAVLCWWGGAQLVRTLTKTASEFQQAKNLAVAGLALSMLLWLVAFLTVGAEWFLMWQSHVWNGQESASRMLIVTGIVLLFLVQPDRDQEN
jgi:predicted small integral membrane protein